MKTFIVEMKHGQDQRHVDADSYTFDDAGGWLIFYRHPAQGGKVEYWRARLDSVVAMETRP